MVFGIHVNGTRVSCVPRGHKTLSIFRNLFRYLNRTYSDRRTYECARTATIFCPCNDVRNSWSVHYSSAHAVHAHPNQSACSYERWTLTSRPTTFRPACLRAFVYVDANHNIVSEENALVVTFVPFTQIFQPYVRVENRSGPIENVHNIITSIRTKALNNS